VTAARPDLAALPGAPESRLSDAVRARLPAASPPPPWPCRVEAVVWWHRASPAALAVLPAALTDRCRLPRVVGAFVRYLDSPVGPYEEVIGAVMDRPLHVHVPFLAVDSLASLHGGRTHWALPKALAAFTRPAGSRGEVVAEGDGWRVAARARPAGPRLPVVARLRGMQVRADGHPLSNTCTGYGRARFARVDVQAGTDLAGQPGSIAGWLRPGDHLGLVMSARLRVGARRG